MTHGANDGGRQGQRYEHGEGAEEGEALEGRTLSVWWENHSVRPQSGCQRWFPCVFLSLSLSLLNLKDKRLNIYPNPPHRIVFSIYCESE